MRWFTALSRGTKITLLASGMGMVAALVVGLLEAPGWAVVGLAVGPGLVAWIGVVVLDREADRERRSERSRREQAERDAQRAVEEMFQRKARAALAFWPAPLMTEADPIVLGVTPPSPALTEVLGNGLGPYIARDQDVEVAEASRARGRLLLVGDPGSGVTRTAY